MTQNEIRKLIFKKYSAGQVVNMRKYNDKNEIIRRFKAEIVEFYDYHVLCKTRGHLESFTYWDMMILTKKGGDK